MSTPIQYDDLPMYWIGDWAGRRAAVTPRRVALLDAATDCRYTYAEMNDRACRVGTYLTDRLGDMILSGGANIYPAEVEHAIDEHPAVQSCAVIGLPDDDLGNRVHAVVHLRPGAAATEEELRAHVAERLVRYKVPRSFEFSGETLRDDAGKVRRSALRAARVARSG